MRREREEAGYKEMRVQKAAEADIPAWLRLAAEVEDLFGPLVEDPGFRRALFKNIARGSAFCVRAGDGGPGALLLGGLLFSSQPPQYRIGWLAVTSQHRNQGIGSALVEHTLSLVTPPAEVAVVTFGADSQAGRPARRFYERFGFEPAESAPNGVEGGSRQVFRLRVESRMSPGRQDLIAVLKETRSLLALPENDYDWSSWENAEQALQEIDGLIAHIEAGAAIPKRRLSVLYAPTGPIQEVSLSSGWGTAFLALARRLDAVVDSL